MKIGEKIRFLRKRNHWTQTELGKMLDVKTNAVSKWECGRVYDIPSSKIKLMARIFDVPISYLVDDGFDNEIQSDSSCVDSGSPIICNQTGFLLRSNIDTPAPIFEDERELVVQELRKLGFELSKKENSNSIATTDMRTNSKIDIPPACFTIADILDPVPESAAHEKAVLMAEDFMEDIADQDDDYWVLGAYKRASEDDRKVVFYALRKYSLMNYK